MEENKIVKKPLPVAFTDKGFINSKFLKTYDMEGQIYILDYMLRNEQWKFEDNKIVFPNITNDIQMKQITKLQELDLKDFYFSRRYASDDYEILTHEEYIDYINNFYELLNELKKIRSEFE